RRPPVHAGGALRRRGRQDHPPDDGGPGQGDLLRDETADGEAEQVNLAQVQGLDERNGLVRHLLRGVCCFPGGAADPRVIEGDDTAVRGQRVDQRGVPVVEIPAEVLQQDQRYPVAGPGVAVRVVNAVRGTGQRVRKLRVSHRGVVAGDRGHVGCLPVRVWWSVAGP